METAHLKRAMVYEHVRRGLQSGRYLPGQRINPATLALELKVSDTPVRGALFQLVGGGLIIDNPRIGLQVPLLSEIAMRDLYDWMERLLLMACEIGICPSARKHAVPALPEHDVDIPKSTWKLFDAIAYATCHGALHQDVKRTNDQLAPIRRGKSGLIENPMEELHELYALWQQQELPALSVSIRAYHARRKRLVPHIVATLQELQQRRA
jgi:DNA-binding transcriptional MocR family regulator